MQNTFTFKSVFAFSQFTLVCLDSLTLPISCLLKNTLFLFISIYFLHTASLLSPLPSFYVTVLANSVRGNYFLLLFFKNLLEKDMFHAEMLIFDVRWRKEKPKTAPSMITRRLILDLF